MILDLIMLGLLGYQIWMPAVNNGMYLFQIDRDGTIIRMNTQTGEMERCTTDLKCVKDDPEPAKELDYKY